MSQYQSTNIRDAHS